ncbi:MAG TPA: siderophore-interacting protein [Bosea sp. (in: a-proteobacteria)]
MTHSDLTRTRHPREEWLLEVVEAFDVAPRLRRVIFTAAHLDELHYQPGQALVLRMPLPDGGTGRRDYTIRWLDRATQRLAIDFVQHGAAPAAEWSRAAMAGDTILAAGPRGRTIIDAEANWHLFAADETGMPAVLHMLEAMPAGAPVFAWIEVDGSRNRMLAATQADATLAWIHRDGARPGPSMLLLDAIAAFALPPGRGQAYLVGETSNVRGLRHHLIGRGMDRSQIRSEGYWRPGRIGGHDHVDD